MTETNPIYGTLYDKESTSETKLELIKFDRQVINSKADLDKAVREFAFVSREEKLLSKSYREEQAAVNDKHFPVMDKAAAKKILLKEKIIDYIRDNLSEFQGKTIELDNINIEVKADIKFKPIERISDDKE